MTQTGAGEPRGAADHPTGGESPQPHAAPPRRGERPVRHQVIRPGARAAGEDGRGGGSGLMWAAVVTALGGMLFGYDTGVVSGALLYIRTDFHTTHFTEQSIVAALLLGAIVGAWVAGRIADAIGRKKTIIGTAVVYLVGVAVCVVAPNAVVLVVGRAVLGLAVGSSSMTVPLYIAEIAPPRLRGGLVSLNQLAITIGILAAGLIDYWLAAYSAWRWMLGLAAIPAVLLAVGAISRPESPAWLAQRGETERAAELLRPLRPAGYDVDGEIHDAIRERESALGMRAALKLAGTAAVVFGVLLAIIQQFTGINTVIYYAPVILSDAGLGDRASILATVLVGAINVAMTIVAIRIIDKVGRRPLLLWGTSLMSLGLLALATTFLAQPHTLSGAGTVFAIGSLMFYVAAFAIGLGPVFWLLISEIYPARARGQAMSLATMANWAANFVVAESFLTLVDWISRPGTFYLFAGLSVLSVVYMAWRVPETKGRSLKDIERQMSHTV